MSCSYLILNINLFKFNTEGKFKFPGENENHFCGYQMYIPHKVSPPLSHVFSPLPQVSSGSQGFYRFLQVPKVSTGFYRFPRFLQVSTGFYRFLQVSTGFYRFLQVSIGFYRFARFLQVPKVSTGFYRFLQVSTGSHGFYRFLQVSTDLYNKFRAGYSLQVVYVQVLKILILNSHNLKMRIWENNSDHQ